MVNISRKIKEEAAQQDDRIISSTGYRTLLVFRALLENDLTIEELNEIIKKDPLTGNAVSLDTARICINTLRNAGVNLSRPSKTNNYKYHLVSHPFTLSLNNDELKILLKLRENISPQTTWQDILKINALYSKIIALTQNFEQIQTVNTSALLFHIKNEVINLLSDRHITGKKVTLKYLSPKFGSESIEVVPQEIVFENRKLYLKCYVYKYSAFSLLDIEKITEITDIGDFEKAKFKNNYEVVYRVFGDNHKSFEIKDYETIVSKTDDYTEVKAIYSNEFCFMQRLLLLGSDFQIVYPDYFRERMISKIKAIQERYTESV